MLQIRGNDFTLVSHTVCNTTADKEDVAYINVHPHSVPLADVSYALQGVKGSLYGGAGCSVDKERVSALS